MRLPGGPWIPRAAEHWPASRMRGQEDRHEWPHSASPGPGKSWDWGFGWCLTRLGGFRHHPSPLCAGGRPCLLPASLLKEVLPRLLGFFLTDPSEAKHPIFKPLWVASRAVRLGKNAIASAIYKIVIIKAEMMPLMLGDMSGCAHTPHIIKDQKSSLPAPSRCLLHDLPTSISRGNLPFIIHPGGVGERRKWCYSSLPQATGMHHGQPWWTSQSPFLGRTSKLLSTAHGDLQDRPLLVLQPHLWTHRSCPPPH